MGYFTVSIYFRSLMDLIHEDRFTILPYKPGNLRATADKCSRTRRINYRRSLIKAAAAVPCVLMRTSILQF